ncbi:aldolase [Diplocarpon rosae]|nr:aldolase [Diplocarpon rosae]
MGKLIKNHWARLIIITASIYQIAAGVHGFFWPKIFWDFVTKNFDVAVKPIPILQSINVFLGLVMLAWEWPLGLLAGSAMHRSIEASAKYPAHLKSRNALFLRFYLISSVPSEASFVVAVSPSNRRSRVKTKRVSPSKSARATSSPAFSAALAAPKLPSSSLRRLQTRSQQSQPNMFGCLRSSSRTRPNIFAPFRRQSLRCLSSATEQQPQHATSNTVKIIEVGPRDGLQNEKRSISLATKIELIQRLSKTGLTDIEAGSFVSPKWVPQVGLFSCISVQDCWYCQLIYYWHWRREPTRKIDTETEVRTVTYSKQMADTSEILSYLLQNPSSTHTPETSISYSFLAPNARGLQDALSILRANSTAYRSFSPPSPPPIETDKTLPSSSPAAGEASTPKPFIELSVFAAATESFTQKNLNTDIATSLLRFKEVIVGAKAEGLRVRAYISVVLGCPFEGYDVDPRCVADIACSLLEMGADEISLGDTTGMGTAPRTAHLLRALSSAGIQTSDLCMHFHDTYGQALVNTAVSLEHGVRRFDSSVGGLGGCPYSPGATGNVSTEDLVYFMESLGMETGVDLEAVAEVGEWITKEVGVGNSSSAGKAILGKRRAER